MADLLSMYTTTIKTDQNRYQQPPEKKTSYNKSYHPLNK